MKATHKGNVRMEPTKRVEMKLSGRVSIYLSLANYKSRHHRCLKQCMDSPVLARGSSSWQAGQDCNNVSGLLVSDNALALMVIRLPAPHNPHGLCDLVSHQVLPASV
jgi:hypothetical protein